MKILYLLSSTLIMLTLLGCSSTKATTSEEFVKKHARAYYFRDAKAVAAMTLCSEDLDKIALPAKVELELSDFKRDSLAKSLKQDMKRDDMWTKAWEDTKYISEQDHGDHIHVEVKVGYAYSNIVLVRVGKYLKIAPNPSAFE